MLSCNETDGPPMSDLATRVPRRKPVGFPPPTRAVACADEMRRRILDGQYAGGMQLRQDALAEEFGVSRIPIREGLLQLEAEGLVKIYPHRGAIVAEFSPAEIQELFEFRALIEPRLLEKSAPSLSSSDFEQLRTILREYGEELRSRHVDRWGALNTQLHTLLYSHADSPKIGATAHQLLQSSDRFTRMQIFYTDGRERAEREHKMIVDLCESSDVAKAADVLRKHILLAGEDLANHLINRKRPAG
jgi:DNA-binding GntR family transcriptional regulator